MILAFGYLRVDTNKPFLGLSTFKGGQPTQAEAMIAKNYLSEQELRVLNNLVSAYFDLAELNAIEQREMRMADFLNRLNHAPDHHLLSVFQLLPFPAFLTITAS